MMSVPMFIVPLILTLALWISAEICDLRADRAYRQQAYESMRQHHTRSRAFLYAAAIVGWTLCAYVFVV